MGGKSLSFDEWPIELRSRWLAGLTPGSFILEAGAISHWAESTLKDASYSIGLFLGNVRSSCIRRLDWDEITVNSLITSDSIDGWIAVLESTRNYRSQATAVGRLLLVCRALYPEQDWRFLKNRVRYLEGNATPPVKQWRLVPAQRLLVLGMKLMKAAENDQSRYAHILYRDGLLIALLISRPMRRRNLTGINIGSQLVEIGGCWHLIFSESETKTGRPIEWPWPEHLVANLEIYLQKYRPRFFLSDYHDGLWAGCKGQALDGEGIYDRICIRTSKEFGHSINPHLFRDCAATTLVTELPDQAWSASRLLGHAKIETTEKYYIHGQMSKANQEYQRILEDYSKGN